LALSACGGGGAGTSGAGGASIGSGFFFDAPVSGVTYTSGNTTGTTGADGSFKYEKGTPVTFTLGGITLGTATGGAVVTPIDFVQAANSTTNAQVQQIGVLLQTLDSDNNPANGIQIDPYTIQAAKAQKVNFATPATVAAALNAIKPGTTPVTPAAAQAHMDKTRRAAMVGRYAGTSTSTCNVGGAQPTVLGTWQVDVYSTGRIAGQAKIPQQQGFAATTSILTGMVSPSGTTAITSSYSAGGKTVSTSTATTAINGVITGTSKQPANPAFNMPACFGTIDGRKVAGSFYSYSGTYKSTKMPAIIGTCTIQITNVGASSATCQSIQGITFLGNGKVSSSGAGTITSGSATLAFVANPYGGMTGTWTDSNTKGSGTFSAFRQ